MRLSPRAVDVLAGSEVVVPAPSLIEATVELDPAAKKIPGEKHGQDREKYQEHVAYVHTGPASLEDAPTLRLSVHEDDAIGMNQIYYVGRQVSYSQ